MILIIVAAVIFGALMGIRGEMPFGWQRAIIAAGAFAVLGWLVSILTARRK